MLLLDFSAKLSASLQRDSMGWVALNIGPIGCAGFTFASAPGVITIVGVPFVVGVPAVDWHPFRF
jgi:hypothetical protein